MRIAVVGAGVGGLAAAIRLAALGHRVRVFEAGPAPGGKCARVTRDGFTWDAGPSLLTMPWVFEALFADTGAPLAEELEMLPVEPVTRYRFADGTSVDLSADAERSRAALEARVARVGAGEPAQRPPRLDAQERRGGGARRPRCRRRRSRRPHRRRPRRRAAQDRLGGAPHPLPGREQAPPVRARAGRPRLQRRARAFRVGR